MLCAAFCPGQISLPVGQQGLNRSLRYKTLVQVDSYIEEVGT
jgi:hypothetical protein